MDDTELLKDLSSLGKPPSFDVKDTMLVNTTVDTRETFIPELSGQKYRKEILPLGEQVLARRPGERVNEHRKAIREMDNQVNQHIEMRQIQHTDKVADDSVAIQRQVSPRTIGIKHRVFKLKVNICKQRIFKLIDLAHEITGVEVAQTTWHKLLDDASTKEAVADDTANSNSLTHSPSQFWSKETKSSGFVEPVGNATKDQDSAKMPEMWTVDLCRRSTVMELASETTVATNSLNTMGTKSKHAGKGTDNHVDVVETNQPSETASTMSAIERDDADESMDMVKPGTVAWRLIHSRCAQNTTEMISGSLLHDHADKYNQLPDESKEQKHTMNYSKLISDPWTRSRRPWRICRSYNIRKSWKRKLVMNSSYGKSVDGSTG